MAAVTDITNEIEDKKEFLRNAGRRLDLKGLVDEEILYTFCGNGRKYILFILQLYPKIGKVYFTNLMDSFNVEHIPRKAELLTADLQDISKLSAHKEYFTHIVSIDCFNWYRNARNGFNVIHHLLRLGGTAAILMTINSPFEDCFKDLIENSAWKHTDLNQESVFPKFPIRLSRNEYKELVKDIGFAVVECEEYYRIFEFESLLDFYEKCMSFISPLLTYIPKDQQPIFENDYLDNFKRLHGVSYRGYQRIKTKTLSLFIRKPAPLSATKSSPPPPPPPPSSSSTSSPYSFSYLGGRF